MSSISRYFVAALLIAAVWSFAKPIYAQDESKPLRDRLDAYLSQLTPDYFSGSVLVARDGEIILHQGYGLANDADGTPVTSDTVFDIGSISKQFTGAAIGLLHQNGELDVNDTLGMFFADTPADKRDITIHQLLTHSAGFEDHHSSSDLEVLGRDEAVERILLQELQFLPGTDYAYSNSGYTLLAAIIETVTRESYQSYLQGKLFERAGMDHTGFYDNTSQWEGETLATGYYAGAPNGKPTDWGDYQWGIVGNGGILSTTGDMYRWWEALRDGSVLSPETVEMIFTPYILEYAFDITYYGYGWTVADTDDGRRIQHNGAGLGGNAIFTAYLDDDLVIVVLNNRIICGTKVGERCFSEKFPADEVEGALLDIILPSN